METKNLHGYFFEDFQVGDRFLSPGRTITEYDVMAFAGISGDYNQLHTDQQYAAQSIYQTRIAHGLLGIAVVSGLAARLGLAEGTALALRSIRWKFREPIKFGDTITAGFEVCRKRELKSGAGGYVEMKVVVQNQSGDMVQNGSWAILVRKRSQD